MSERLAQSTHASMRHVDRLEKERKVAARQADGREGEGEGREGRERQERGKKEGKIKFARGRQGRGRRHRRDVAYVTRGSVRTFGLSTVSRSVNAVCAREGAARHPNLARGNG
jgi:hypothetical protein